MSEQSYTPVRDVMTKSPIVIDGLATVSQAVELMRQHNVSSIIIDKRDASDEYGMVVVRDIAEKIVGANRSADRVNIYEIMDKPVLTLDVGMNVKYAVRLLFRYGLTRALVLDKGKVCGIVTLRDLVLRSIPAPSSAREA
ncbi:MAG: CBS domain-containing protein [Hyphococcus sp.]